MAPDKIYLYREQPKDYFDEAWHELLASDVENIEYLRKDTLMELLKEKRKSITECSATEERKVAALSVIDFLINEIESL